MSLIMGNCVCKKLAFTLSSSFKIHGLVALYFSISKLCKECMF